jgi:hypothetical protein
MGGAAAIAGPVLGIAGGNYGGGGSGAVFTGSSLTTGKTGGSGAAGVVIFEW